MSNWITITETDLVGHKVAALVKALRTAALGDGQPDPLPGEIAKVVTWIRNKVASCATNRLDVDPAKIPASLKSYALDMIIFGLKNRLERALTEAEQDRRSRIERELNRIADCRDVVESPDNPITPAVEGGGGIVLVTPGQRRASRRQTAGL